MNKISQQSLKIFSVVVPQPGDKPDRIYYFTTEDSVVSFNGQQYIPLSQHDAENWGLLPKQS